MREKERRKERRVRERHRGCPGTPWPWPAQALSGALENALQGLPEDNHYPTQPLSPGDPTNI